MAQEILDTLNMGPEAVQAAAEAVQVVQAVQEVWAAVKVVRVAWMARMAKAVEAAPPQRPCGLRRTDSCCTPWSWSGCGMRRRRQWRPP